MSKDRLLRLLQKPQHYEPKERAWKRLTTGDELYRALSQAIATGPIDEALPLWELWKTYAEFGTDEMRRRWEFGRRLIWCAAQAATGVQMNGTVGFASQESVWQRICANCFTNEPIRELRLPIAGVDHGGLGFNATLQLQLFSGADGLIHHPIDLFSTTVDAAFESSMFDAWISALTNAKKSNPQGAHFDGCWRVLDVNDAPITELNGASASGSAAVGLLQALGHQSAAIDDRVIVLARSNQAGALEEVDGVTAKAKAIAAESYIDTIIVAGPGNKREAEAGIRQVANSDRIQVLCHDNLVDAANSYSQLASGLIDYFNSLAAELDQTDWHGVNKTRVKISEIAVPTRFTPMVMDSLDANGDESTNEKAHPQVSVPTTVSSIVEEPEVLLGQLYPDLNMDLPPDPQGVESFDQDDSTAEEELSWDDVWPPGYQELVLIRGEPGSGKTVHSMFAAARTAESLAKHLAQREVGVNEITRIPVWIPLTNFAREGLAKDTAAAILGAVEDHFRKVQLKPDVRAFITAKLRDHAVLFFDGLDEIDGRTQIDQINCRFQDMQDWQSPICVTCRTGYDSSMLAGHHVSEYQLADFRWGSGTGNKREIEAFISNWFASQSDSAKELLDILKLNLPIHQQCQSPLLLTLTCLAHQSRAMTDQTNSADLYASVLKELLRGKWRIGTGSSGANYEAFGINDEEQLIDCVRTCLSHLASQLAATGLSRNRFRSSELLAAMESTPASSRPSSIRQAIVWLQNKGILVKDGFERDEPCYSFIHRTMFEYLVAQGLKARPDCAETLRTGLTGSDLHSAVAWSNILPSLIASVNEPDTFISMLIDLCCDERYRDRQDTFRRILTTCLLESRGPLRDFELRDSAFETVLRYVDTAQKKRPDEWRVLVESYELTRIFSAVEKHYDAPLEVEIVSEVTRYTQVQQGKITSNAAKLLLAKLDSVKATDHPAAPIRWASLRVEVVLGKDKVAPKVSALLRDKSAVVRSLACRASTVTNRQTAFEALTEILLNDTDAYARGGAAGALGRLGDKRALPYLKSLCSPATEPERAVRAPVMWALTRLCDAQSQELSDIFKAGLTDVDNVQTSAIHGLVKLGCQEIWPALVTRLEECEMPNVRREAAWALGRFAAPGAVPALVKGLSDPDKSVADRCYSSIMNYALDQARSQVEGFILKATENEKRHLAFTWRESIKKVHSRNPGHFEAAVRFCINLTKDQSPKVRETASRTLTVLMRLPVLRNHPKLGKATVEQGLVLLKDPEQRVRRLACDLLADLGRLKSPFLVQNMTLSRAVLVQALNLLDREINPEVQASACRILIELARTGTTTITKNELLIQRILREAFKLSKTVAPQLKISALMAFQALLSPAMVEANERLSSQVAGVALDLLDHDSFRVRRTALITLKGLTNTTNLQDEALSKKVVLGIITALDDANPQVRASAVWTLAHMAKRPGPSLTDPDPLLGAAVSSLRNRLEKETSPQVLAYTLKSFEFLARAPSVKENEELMRSLAQRSSEILTTGSIPQLRASALCLLQVLLKVPSLGNNKPLQVNLAMQCLELLDRSRLPSSAMKQKNHQVEFGKSVALSTLSLLVSMPALRNKSELTEEILDSGLRMTKDNSDRVSASALTLLLAVAQTNSSFTTAQAHTLVERGCAMLSKPLPYARSISFMLLERVVAQNYPTNENVVNRITEHCLKALNDPEAEVRAAALQTLETVLRDSSDSESTSFTNRITGRHFHLLRKATNDKSHKVRSAAYGVVGNLLGSNDTEVGRLLIEPALKAAQNEAPDVRKSAIWQLDAILTKTDLNTDLELSRTVMERLISLLHSPGSSEVRVVTIRSLENILMQTVLRYDEAAARMVVDQVLAFLDESAPAVRKVALGALQTMTQGYLHLFRHDNELVTKLIERFFAFVKLEDRLEIASFCQVMAGLVKLRPKVLFSDTQKVRSIIDSTVELLNQPDAVVQTSACRLLISLVGKQPEPIFEAQTVQLLLRQSAKMLANSNEQLQNNAAELLAKLVNGTSRDVSEWEEGLLQRICDVGRALLRDSEPARVLRSALIMLKVLNDLPPDDEKTAAVQNVQKRALTFMDHSDQMVRVNAISLLVELLRGNVDLWRKDSQFVKRVAQKCLQLLETDSNANVQASACWLLCSMGYYKLEGFTDDQMLVNTARDRANLINERSPANVLKNAQALLKALRQNNDQVSVQA